MMPRLKRLLFAAWRNHYLWSAVAAAFAVDSVLKGQAVYATLFAFFAGGNLACASLDRTFREVTRAGRELAACCDQWEERYRSQGRTLNAALDALSRKAGDR